MVLIQIVAALLLLLGSGLIFRALVEMDPPARPRYAARGRFARTRMVDDAEDLRRAA